MGRTNYNNSRAGFIDDPNSVIRGTGAQIDWANVNVSYKNADGNKVLPAGTVVGKLLGSGKVSPRIVTTNPATGILETAAVENDLTAAKTGYSVIHGGRLFENLLPDATGGPPATLPSAFKTELTTAGCFFQFATYSDVR